MKIRPKHIRSSVNMTNQNVNMLSLQEAVSRSERTGTFLMAERGEDGGFEGSDNSFDPDTMIQRLSKVDTALNGIDAAGKLFTKEPEPKPNPEPTSNPELKPSE